MYVLWGARAVINWSITDTGTVRWYVCNQTGTVIFAVSSHDHIHRWDCVNCTETVFLIRS